MLEAIFARQKIIPVITLDRVEDAVPLACALSSGGLDVLEVTFRTEAAAAAIQVIRDQVPAVTVGAGTVTTPAILQAAETAGATFFVSPGATDALLSAANPRTFLPGVATLSEMMRAFDAGFQIQKFFPAEALGGTNFLRSVSAPLPQLQFCATGGIHAGNLADYLALPSVLAIGGSWMVPAGLIRAGDWDEITRLAQSACSLAAGAPSSELDKAVQSKGSLSHE
ncbi:bifunctional 4-hydroxy-2-oxoglutarate aldolase/2-dehydro-3-deoxy-phosphogluconate aldolase [Pseudomonadales bacterium]|nr:bifunctional 4-hydroxy-2-oxoglutarate aldolase/2-dehydro-3-deoxy-phosphogluconate aldolase [Pseudomonadales bacterium]